MGDSGGFLPTWPGGPPINMTGVGGEWGGGTPTTLWTNTYENLALPRTTYVVSNIDFLQMSL